MTDIEILQSLKAYTCKLEVIDRAIEALKAEPCVETLTSGYVQEIKYPCVDCISKAELVRKLNAWDHNVNAIPNYVWRVIRELPSVTPAPKIGRWEYNQYDGNPNIGNWHCSECHSIIDYKPLYKWEKGPEFKYCPYCGSFNGGDINDG